MSTINGSNGPDHITAPSTDDSIYGNGGNDTLNGAGGNDYIDGGLGDDSMLGGVGFDTLLGGPGNDTIDGGADFDLVTYSSSTGAVQVNLGTGVASDGLGGTDTLLNIEDIEASDYDDTLQGDGNANWFYPDIGDDTVHAGGDTDIVAFAGYFSQFSFALGGAANELIVTGPDGVDDLFDVEFLQFFDVTVSPVLGTAASEVLGGGDEADVMLGGGGNDSMTGAGGDDRLYGGTGTDSISGGTGNDIVDGGTGRDTMQGGTGNDTYYVDSVTDVVQEPDSASSIPQGAAGQVNVGDVGDTINTSVDWTLGNAIENLQQLGASALSGTGNVLANILTGNGANDTLAGLAGNDTLFGGGGDDSLDGGTGNDSMAGGAGNDRYVVDSPQDVTDESTGSGDDTVTANVDYTIGTGVDRLELTGSADLAGTGNAIVNVITGNEGRNVLTGAAGNDTLDGGAGIDTAAYDGSRSAYTVTNTGAGFSVSGSTDGVDTLLNIERLQFGDTHVAIDIEGNAGDVVKILGAVFGASFVHDAAFVGIGLHIADQGLSFEALMQLALDSRLGATHTNAQVVELLYTNVVGIAPGAAEVASYSLMITSGALTQVSLGVFAANTGMLAERIGLSALSETGIEFA